MAISAGLTELLKELLGPMGDLQIRHMFGGAGVYSGGVMFALVAEDIVYLKVDEASRGAFEAEGMAPFTYATKDGSNTIGSYWRAPERLLDDQDEVLEWARRALAVAEAAQRGKAKRRTGGRKGEAGRDRKTTRRSKVSRRNDAT